MSDEKTEAVAINIIFDGPPSQEFLVVQDDQGARLKVEEFGECIETEDGFWALRIDRLPEK